MSFSIEKYLRVVIISGWGVMNMPLTDDDFLKNGVLGQYIDVIESLRQQEGEEKEPEYQLDLDDEEELIFLRRMYDWRIYCK